jgi:hypothetical protein
MEEYGTARHATEINMVRSRKESFACRTTKARIRTHTHNISYLLLFYCSNGYANAPQFYVILTVSILCYIIQVY